MFDGTTDYPATVVVRDGVIDAVATGEVTIVAGDTIDISGDTVLPGMMDLHVHTPAPPGPYGYYDSVSHVDGHLKAMLRNGVTSFLDLGSQYYTNKCARLCDPASATPDCEAGQTCKDRTSSAGLPVGECG